MANGTFNFADQYSLDAPGDATKGTFSYRGSVRFYEGLALPGAFIPNNPATIAGDLPSTTVDPQLPGGTPRRTHNLAGSWDCCPAGTANPTTITSHRP